MTIRLFLFDLDGTLMLSGGAGMRAIEKVFQDFYDLPDAFEGIVPDGKIDPAIFREIIDRRGLDSSDEDEAVQKLTLQYIEALKKEMPVSPDAMLMPGIPELLERLDGSPDVLLGLVTGNIEQGAYIKLARFDLNRFFPFGAFGSDHEDRAELVRIAVRRAEQHAGRPISMGKNVFVIGDTPRDVQCGIENGTSTVGVAWANFTVEQLRRAGADYVFEDFGDVERVAAELLGD